MFEFIIDTFKYTFELKRTNLENLTSEGFENFTNAN